MGKQAVPCDALHAVAFVNETELRLGAVGDTPLALLYLPYGLFYDQSGDI